MITSVDIDDKLYEKGKILAVKEKRKFKEIINEALREYLQRKAKAVRESSEGETDK